MIVDATTTSGFEIFKPLWSGPRGAKIFISTWNVSPTWDMMPVIEEIKASEPAEVSLLVGYSKTTHAPDALLANLMSYKKIGWKVRALPSFHTKVWVVDYDAWVGSANFVKSTIVNGMWHVHRSEVTEHLLLNWRQAGQLSKTTDLRLLPQAKRRQI